jgi:hypothetical protein
MKMAFWWSESTKWVWEILEQRKEHRFGIQAWVGMLGYLGQATAPLWLKILPSR